MSPFSGHLGRRTLLAGAAGLAATPLLDWARGDSLPLLTQARAVSRPFLDSLVCALEGAFAASGARTRVVPLAADRYADIERLSAGAPGPALLFAGAGWEDAWLNVLANRRVLSLGLGTELREDARHVSGPLHELIAAGATWSASALGRRAALVVTPDLLATDLPYVFRTHFERASGTVDLHVVEPGHEPAAWRGTRDADFAMVLSGGQAALWQHAPTHLPLLTHERAGGEGRGHVLRGELPLMEALAARTVARWRGLPAPRCEAFVSLLSGERRPLPAAPSLAPLAFRNRSSAPFTGC